MTSSPGTFLSSPRSQRLMLLISGAVLMSGIAVFLGVFLFGGRSQDVHAGTPSPSPAPLPGPNVSSQTVPASPDARKVARLFLETAVARKNLATAYAITGPWLKGVPRAQWISGSNPVTFYPAGNLKTAPFKTLASTKSALLLEVGPLVPRKGNTNKALRPLSFKLEVDRIRGKWLVNYFMPQYKPGVNMVDKQGMGGN